MNEKTFERFAAKVALPDGAGCMRWMASTHKGYGQFWADGRRQAHRLAYEHWVGPIPYSLVIDHLCRNRRCVAPEHLRAVTSRENTFAEGSKALAATEAARTHCPRGHELTAGNLVSAHARRGWRDCLICRRAQGSAASAARRAACEVLGITYREFLTGRYSGTDVYRDAYAAAKRLAGVGAPRGGAR